MHIRYKLASFNMYVFICWFSRIKSIHVKIQTGYHPQARFCSECRPYRGALRTRPPMAVDIYTSAQVGRMPIHESGINEPSNEFNSYIHASIGPAVSDTDSSTLYCCNSPQSVSDMCFLNEGNLTPPLAVRYIIKYFSSSPLYYNLAGQRYWQRTFQSRIKARDLIPPLYYISQYIPLPHPYNYI